MNELVTTDTILAWLTEQVESKRPISPELWLDACMKLNLLRSDDNDQLIELEHNLAIMRADYIREGGTSSAAKIILEAEDEFREAEKLKAKLKVIEEAIRLGKKYAWIKNEEYKSNY